MEKKEICRLLEEIAGDRWMSRARRNPNIMRVAPGIVLKRCREGWTAFSVCPLCQRWYTRGSFIEMDGSRRKVCLPCGYKHGRWSVL